MLYMITEHFRNNDPGPVGERFRDRGRLIPEGSGVEYVASWMALDGSVCFQIMEAPSREALDGWIANWRDLVDFEVTPIATSADFWARRK